MNGPTVTVTNQTLSLADLNFVQEQLAPVGLSYALLGYVPATPRTVQIFVNGALLIQGVHYTIDGRKIQFTADLQAANDVVAACYFTQNAVADIPAVEIAFDIPGQNVRISSAGSLQVLQDDGYWHDMIPSTNPITGDFTLEVDQDVSLNQ